MNSKLSTSEIISSPISLVFLGAGPIAAKSLEFLYSNFTIESVITKPAVSKAKSVPPVIKFCQDNNLPYLTPDNKTAISEIVNKQAFASRFAVVVDYGIIINQDVIDSFPLGIVNSHFSLLPEWRGADPITFAVLSGQKTTGVSLMLINDKMDEGPIIAQSDIQLPKDITTPELTDELLDLSNAMLAEMLPFYFRGQIQAIPQSQLPNTPLASYSRKLAKADGALDFTKPAEDLERQIRAFLDWPKSYARLGKVDVIITKAHVVTSTIGKSGEITITKDGSLLICCGKNSLVIDEIKPAGKKNMSATDFVRGYKTNIII